MANFFHTGQLLSIGKSIRWVRLWDSSANCPGNSIVYLSKEDWCVLFLGYLSNRSKYAAAGGLLPLGDRFDAGGCLLLLGVQLVWIPIKYMSPPCFQALST